MTRVLVVDDDALAHVRSKLEPDPRRPRSFLTDPGIGYRFVSAPPEEST